MKYFYHSQFYWNWKPRLKYAVSDNIIYAFLISSFFFFDIFFVMNRINEWERVDRKKMTTSSCWTSNHLWYDVKCGVCGGVFFFFSSYFIVVCLNMVSSPMSNVYWEHLLLFRFNKIKRGQQSLNSSQNRTIIK